MESFTTALIDSMMDFLPNVMMNQFGNYLCQKLIDVSSVNDIKKIIAAVMPNLIQICMDNHGTRVMQTLIEVMAKEHTQLQSELSQIIYELNNNIFELCLHANGNHVIQQLLLVFKASENPGDPDLEGAEELGIYTNFIFNACMQYCDEIGSDKHGCCVMQRCLEKGLLN